MTLEDGIKSSARFLITAVGPLSAPTMPRRIPGNVQALSGSTAQINMEALAQRSGVKLQHVPYKGAGPAVNAFAIGEVAMAIASPPSVLGLIAEGKLQALAVGSEKRLAQLPNVPTLAEAGIAGDVLVPTFLALTAPAGTAPKIIAKLNSEMRRAVMAADVAERLQKSGLTPAGGAPEQMADTVKRDVAAFGALINAVGIKAE